VVEPLRGTRVFSARLSSSSVCEIASSLNESNRLGFFPDFAGEECTVALPADIEDFLVLEG
jgi:hypothetical protein